MKDRETPGNPADPRPTRPAPLGAGRLPRASLPRHGEVEHAGHAGSGPKVLVVDDSAITREMVALLLEERGFQVVTLDTPIGFSRVLLRERPALVLIDVSMPALAGDKLVEATHKSRLYQQLGETGCPLVLHSDRSDADLRELCEKSGAQGYIRKTGDGDALVRAINGFLRAPSSSLRPASPHAPHASLSGPLSSSRPVPSSPKEPRSR